MSDNKTKEQLIDECSSIKGDMGIYLFLPNVYEKMQSYADHEKRSTAIAFLNAVTEDGCDNYFRVGDDWFLGDPEEEEDAEGPFTTEQVYDLYIQSLPK